MTGRCREDGGSAVVEFVVLATVLLVPLVYLVLFLGRLQAGSYAVTTAARDAGRAYVTAPEEAEAAARAQAAARIAFADEGYDRIGDLAVTCAASPCLTPGAAVSVVARVDVPLPLIPAFARRALPLRVPVSASYVATVDRFRSAP